MVVISVAVSVAPSGKRPDSLPDSFPKAVPEESCDKRGEAEPPVFSTPLLDAPLDVDVA
ncbi:hypothetical protein CJ184_000245 [Actinotignum urinale]|uniref:hypothetical protein n=1 Tax=Actinotignum urinale TaxID=190146 RepID=UPI002543F5AF|nr:hypothetical protein [Actinotignum urinale]WIK59139.1 hypothetical protein CJ184_000245 [Actinotignum urinale]